MATYMMDEIGKPKDSVFRIYLCCSPEEQALRMIDRDLRNTEDNEPDVTNELRSAIRSFGRTKNKVADLAEIARELERVRRTHEQPHAAFDHMITQFTRNAERDSADRCRFQALYGTALDYRDPIYYDLVVDTSAIGEEEKLRRAMDAVERKFLE